MKDRKRILFVCGGSHVSGAEIVTLQIMQSLAQRGHVVHCVVNSWNDGDFINRLNDLHIAYTPIKLGFIYLSKLFWTLDSLLHYPKAAYQFIRIQQSFQPDYVYHTSYKTVLLLYPFLKKSNNILHVHDAFEASAKNKRIFKFVTERIHLFIAVSNFIKQNLCALSIEEEKIKVVLNGVPTLSEDEISFDKTDYTSLRIGIVGQIVPRKGHEDLIDALSIVRKEGKLFSCLIFGKGPEDFKLHLQNKIKALGLEDVVDWKGYIRNQAEIYQNIDVVIVPTLADEPFGMVAAEPAFWALPVIASRTGGLPEIIMDEVTGFLIDPGNIYHIADRINYFIENPSIRKQMGINAYQQSRKRLTSDRMCSEIETLLI
jgi:glycosyltransferase involved in cell wall biosynthesis